MNERENVRGRWAVISHVSWGAIFAGAVVVLVVQLTLAMLGLGIGLYTMGPGEGPTAALGIGALIWWVVSAIIALFLGGWVASRLSGIQTRTDGMLHGFVTWGLASLVTVFLMTSTVGAFIGGGMSLIQGLGGAAGTTAEISPELRQELEEQLRQYFPDQQPQASPEQKERLQERATETAEQVRKGAARGAMGTFVMLVLGGVAAAFGGAAGRTRAPKIT
jgi:ABC-type multidrug transport system fused ATPase/permease subunit